MHKTYEVSQCFRIQWQDSLDYYFGREIITKKSNISCPRTVCMFPYIQFSSYDLVVACLALCIYYPVPHRSVMQVYVHCNQCFTTSGASTKTVKLKVSFVLFVALSESYTIIWSAVLCYCLVLNTRRQKHQPCLCIPRPCYNGQFSARKWNVIWGGLWPNNCTCPAAVVVVVSHGAGPWLS